MADFLGFDRFLANIFGLFIQIISSNADHVCRNYFISNIYLAYDATLANR